MLARPRRTDPHSSRLMRRVYRLIPLEQLPTRASVLRVSSRAQIDFALERDRTSWASHRVTSRGSSDCHLPNCRLSTGEAACSNRKLGSAPFVTRQEPGLRTASDTLIAAGMSPRSLKVSAIFCCSAIT